MIRKRPPGSTLTDDVKADLIETAHAVADAARAAILPHFRSRHLNTEDKGVGHFDPVTVADRASEAAMRAVLAKRRPDDAIMGEEEAAKPGTSGLTWVLDPIDGTRAFVSGTPTWGVLIAINDANGPVFGIIDQPYVGERFEGGFDRARLVGPMGEAALRTRSTTELSEATLFSTFPEIGTEAERARFARVRDRVKLTRYGLDCYAYGLLALGQIDLVIEAGLGNYDIAAPIAVIEAAGGIVTDWTGGPAHNGGRALAAANSDIHAKALTLLSDIGDG